MANVKKKYVRDYEARADEIISKLTLEEKVSQLVFNSPSIEKLGINPYTWWNEALHGVARAGVATVFPQSMGLAAMFDSETVYEVADVISTEARAKSNESRRKGDYEIYKGLTFWSPNVNIFRDPRWGRGQETYGEDPYLTARTGVAFICGMQGNDPKYLKTAACAKHYAVHSGPEMLRHGFDAVVSKKDLFETYLPAFRACVEEAEVESVMGAYNAVYGEPCCASEYLLKDILRGKFGFEGHVVSDCGAIGDIYLHHHRTPSMQAAVAAAVKAGCDLDCGKTYGRLVAALAEGLITEEEIGQSLKRLLVTKMKLGLLPGQDDNPYGKIPYSANNTREHSMLALKAARRTLVLLENDGTLPFDRAKIKKVAIVGPNADNRVALYGNYNGTASRYLTPIEGFREYLGDENIFYAPGCELYKEHSEPETEHGDRFCEAESTAMLADAVVLCVGLDGKMEGEEGGNYKGFEKGDRDTLELPPIQLELIGRMCALGKPVVIVNFSGSAVNLEPAKAANALVQAWYPGQCGGLALAELLFGEFSPSGRLPVTFYKSIDDLPPFEDYAMANRTYRYFTGTPLYPFGYGLSYTDFEYLSIRMSTDSVKPGETVTATVTVKNTGRRASDLTVLLYIKDDEASVPVPLRALCGFKRVFVEPGETLEVEFDIAPEQMSIVGDDGELRLESGSFTLFCGDAKAAFSVK